MIEIKLENGKSGKLKNSYNYSIFAEKTNNHFFLTINDVKYGPFARLFMSKHDNGDSVIIGYFPKESHIIKISEKRIDISTRNITATSQLREYDIPTPKSNSQLLGIVNNYHIYFENNKFFAVNNDNKNESLDSLVKFDEYDDLIEYYKKLGISLSNSKIANQAAKLKRIFIKFDDLYEYINSIKANDLSEDLQLDIVMERAVFKSFFTTIKKACAESTSSKDEADDLLNKGYVELQYRTIEKFKEVFPQEYEKLNELINNKAICLKDECIVSLKEKDSIDFDSLCRIIKEVKIPELTDNARKEIGARRPLTPSIFSGVIGACIDKLKDQGIRIREDYKTPKTLKTLYPDEYQVLWALTDNRLEDLYNEYVEYQKEKFNKIIKKY